MRHFYSLNEFSSEQIAEFVDSALAFKESPYSEVLERRQIARTPGEDGVEILQSVVVAPHRVE